MKSAPKKVLLLYHEDMLKHAPPVGVFDEIPDRLVRSKALLEQEHVFERCKFLTSSMVEERYLSLNHEKVYIDGIRNWATDSKKQRRVTEKNLEEVYMSPGTSDAALLAAGSVVEASHLVFDGVYSSAFALVRPPGHHAAPCQGRGFCVFNNVAIAAKSLLRDKNAKRVLIVDWDVHFGDGTQAAFEKSPDVLYFSLHRYDYKTYFPYDPKADYSNVGVGPGRFFTINVPFNRVTCGDAEYFAVWDDVLIPVVREYKPEIILISGGFDAAVGDMGKYEVSPRGFSVLLRKLMDEKQKIVLALEGGYKDNLPDCVLQCTKALLGDDLEDNAPRRQVKARVRNIIAKVRSVHSEYWKCFSPTVPEVIPSSPAMDISPNPAEGSDYRKVKQQLVNDHKSSPGFCKSSPGFRVGRSSPVKRNVSRSIKTIEAAVLPKKKSISRSAKAGIQFPAGHGSPVKRNVSRSSQTIEAAVLPKKKSVSCSAKAGIQFTVGHSCPVKRIVSHSRKSVEAAVLPKKKSISRSAKAGIQFPVGRIHRFLRKGGYAKRLGFEAPVYFAAVLDYLAGEVLHFAGNAAKDKKVKKIISRHVMLAIRNDEEFRELCKHVIIPGGGVPPNINPALLPRKKARKATKR